MKSPNLKTEKQYIKFLKEASDAYYNTGDTIVSDQEFDRIRDEFQSKFPDSKYLSDVGTDETSRGFKKVKHSIPMGSLQKVTGFEEIESWATKNNFGKSMVWSEKIDGLSVSIEFADGKIKQAVTRGDGTTGEDITQNVLKMNINQNIPYTGSIIVRGEIALSKNNFDKYFKIQNKSNARNSAVGAVKRLDGAGCEHLDVLIYNAVSSDLKFDTVKERFEFIQNTLKLKTPNWGIASCAADVKSVWDQYEKTNRATADFDMDGLVIDFNDLSTHEELGFVSNRPKFAKALKFTSEEGTTVIESVVLQVGRTGRITPVAKVASVNLSGANVTNVTLHNFEEVKRLDLRVGQSVTIRRSGDVIPQIIGTLNDHGTKILPPANCPSCQSKLKQEDVFLRCTNSECPAKVYENLLYWVTTLDIKDFGDKLVEQLIQSGKLKTTGDFYRLKAEDISSLERRGDKVAEKVLAELHKNKELSLPVFVQALGLDGIGKSTMELIESKYNDLDLIYGLKVEDLSSIHGIGDITAKALLDGLNERKNLIKDLLNYVSIKKEVQIQGTLTGQTFCFTGFRDKELGEKIKGLGGKMLESVSKDLTTLVALDPEEKSGKLDKARKLGIKIITPTELKSIIG